MKNDVCRREKLYITQKHGNSAAAHACKAFPFSVTNEIGLENYLGYQCTKFGEDRLKIESARDYRLHWLRCYQTVHTHTYARTRPRTHERTSTEKNIVCAIPCTWIGQTIVIYWVYLFFLTWVPISFIIFNVCTVTTPTNEKDYHVRQAALLTREVRIPQFT